MKKSLIALLAVSLTAFLTGCGGGGGGSSTQAVSAFPIGFTPVVGIDNDIVDTTTTNTEVFNTDPVDSATNATYVTSAQGAFPPAPPVSSLIEAQEAANTELASN